MDRSPPPFFHQGPSARARVLFFALLAIALIFVDARVKLLSQVRHAVGTVLYPLQWALVQPMHAVGKASGHMQDVDSLLKENQRLRERDMLAVKSAAQSESLATENNRLRALLELKANSATKSVVGQVQFENRDPYTQRFILDKGAQHGVREGQPVLDPNGLAGLITRVFPASSEVALLTDRDITIPVQMQRSGLRSVAYGSPINNALELRYLPATIDIKSGDQFVTSGLDTLYPAGIKVGTVSRVEPNTASTFTKAWLTPSANLRAATHLLILLTEPSLPMDPALLNAEGKRKAKARP